MALLSSAQEAFSLHLYVLLPLCGLGLTFLYLLYVVLDRLYFSPLRAFPGPKLWALSDLPYVRTYLTGTSHRKMLELHQKYGPIVRILPNGLSINHPDGMSQVRGHRRTGENPKAPITTAVNGDNIIGADRADHQRFRRALSRGFSAQVMLEQQPIIRKYVDTLFTKLHQECSSGTKAIDIEKWFNYTTFDIIGDLSFGEPFGCLEEETYHPWVSLVFQGVKNMAYILQLRRFPKLFPLLMFFLPKSISSKFREHKELSQKKVEKRLALGKNRPDFIDSMVRKQGDPAAALTTEEIASNASMLIIAGSETTATLLSAATYLIGTHPDVLEKLTQEVRTTFKTEDEIDMLSVQNLQYLLAVLDESARIYPPVPAASPRVIGDGGDNIIDHYIPEGTTIDIWQWAIYHNPSHFVQPEEFIPERWTGDPRFANDARQAVQPFSVGPRNCIGKNLAYAEMRMILARLVWNFDIRIAEDTLNWMNESEVYVLWQKGPVNVYLTPRIVEKA